MPFVILHKICLGLKLLIQHKFILTKQFFYCVISPRNINNSWSITKQRKGLLVFISSQTVAVHICQLAAAWLCGNKTSLPYWFRFHSWENKHYLQEFFISFLAFLFTVHTFTHLNWSMQILKVYHYLKVCSVSVPSGKSLSKYLAHTCRQLPFLSRST